MTRHLVIFFACFLLGAVATAAVRAALHRPYAGQAHASVTAPPAAAPAPAAPATSTTPVNTICAICSMPVDPKIPTAQYRGATIGFGCKMCPPKFAADPEKYGPAFLANRVVEE